MEAKWIWHDGGRAGAGFVGSTGDCVVHAIAIATGKEYREVYDAIYAANNPPAAEVVMTQVQQPLVAPMAKIAT
jgi:hypothetical protein